MFQRASGRTSKTSFRLAALASLVAGGGACTSLAPSSDSAQTLGYTPASSSASTLPEEWACLSKPLQVMDRAPARVTYIVPIVDFYSQPIAPTPVPNLTITVCASPTCDPPRLVWTASKDGGAPTVVDHAPDPASAVVIENPVGNLPPFIYAINFPYGLDTVSLRLTAPNYAEMDYYLGGPMVGRPEGSPDGGADQYTVLGLAIPLLTQGERSLLYGQIGIPIPEGGTTDPSRGVLAVRTLNCLRDQPGPGGTAPSSDGTRAANVTLQLLTAPDSLSQPWTLSFQGAATGGTLVTEDRGVAGYINLPPHSYRAQAMAPTGPDGGTGYGANTFVVRPDVITLAEIRDGIDHWGQ